MRMFGDNGIETLAIGRHDILDVCYIFQAAFYLERASTSLNQFLKML